MVCAPYALLSLLEPTKGSTSSLHDVKQVIVHKTWPRRGLEVLSEVPFSIISIISFLRLSTVSFLRLQKRTGQEGEKRKESADSSTDSHHSKQTKRKQDWSTF